MDPESTSPQDKSVDIAPESAVGPNVNSNVKLENSDMVADAASDFVDNKVDGTRKLLP